MSNGDFSHEILRLRKECIEKKKDDNSELMELYEELMNWQEKIIDEFKNFIQTKYQEIKQKYFEINEQKLRSLNHLYSSNHFDQQYYSQFIENYKNHQSPIEILYPKQLDFNSYLQLNIKTFNDIQRSLTLNNHFNLPTYKLHSNISIKTNLTPLFSTHDHLLVYYDHHTSSASLHIFDLKTYLEKSHHHSCLKSRVPCNQFQGKIMHMDYSECLQAFLLSTGSKLFLLQISNTGTNYNVQEYLDIAHRNYLGILQKFVCHPITSNLIYFLIKTLSDYTLVQMDLRKIFSKGKKWIYPKDVNHHNEFLNTTNDRSHLQLTDINDFILGKDVLIFAVTYQSNKSDDNLSHELHIRSSDMHLQHRLRLNSNLCPLRLCMIPYSGDYSSEQFLLIYDNSKILSLYDYDPFNDNDDKIQLIDEITLDTEPLFIGFVNNDRTILLLRNHFDIAIYKHINNRL